MSDGGTGEKTEEPTPERLRKLRKEGNVSKSQDVTQAVILVVAFAVMAAWFSHMSHYLMDLFRLAVHAGTTFGQDQGSAVVQRFFWDSLLVFAKVIAPIAIAAFVMAIAMNLAQVGFMFTVKPITPDIKKINPVQGLKNLFNKKKIFELFKNLAKFGVVSYMAYLAIADAIHDVVHIIRSPISVGMGIMGGIILDMVLKIGLMFAVIAAVDYIYQKKKYIKDNMMSKYDVKQEYKQSEGDPQHKAKRKQFHQEIINSAAPSSIKKADAVIVNPHQIAVAIQYDKEDGGTPKVLAKGERIWAEKIKEAAKRYGVPILRNVPLAQALNKLDIGEDIPEELYEAVAEVLTFVFQLAEEEKKR